MMGPRRLAGALAVAALLAGDMTALADAPGDDAAHVEVSLISEQRALAPGQSVQIGLRLQHDAGWHTYWINPGDSGLPTRIAWTVPDGYRTHDIAWPIPKRFDVGGLANFGYDGDVVLPVVLEVPDGAKAGDTVHLEAKASWLVCHEQCIPGRRLLTLDVPVAKGPAEADPRWIAAFAAARKDQPVRASWNGSASLHGDLVRIALTGEDVPDAGAVADAFVAQHRIVDNRRPSIRRDGDTLIVESAKSDYFADAPSSLDLVVAARGTASVPGWEVHVPWKAAPAATSSNR